jgi:hypothetical protein
MEPTFYDQNGSPIAYTADGETIFLFEGEPVAYIHGNSVYSFHGTHIGWFENGWLRDHHGAALFFTDNASGRGPLRPFKQLKPLKSLRQLKPLKGLRQLKPIKPMTSFLWSDISPEAFFRS